MKSICHTILILVLCMIIPEICKAQFDKLSDSSCGTRTIRYPKIINGTNAVHGHYPWIISLQLNNRHHCGGSLIRPNWVLTAAHCVYRINSKRFKVKLGGYLRNVTSEPTSITVKPVMVIAHTGFTYATFADDLALIKLPYKVKYTNYIRPVCLPSVVSDTLKEDKAMVIGWGKLKQGGMSANILQEVQLPIVDNSQCISWYREKGKMLTIRPTQICAGLEEGGKDACQGDSGSPMLVTNNQTKQTTVVGIVSAGIGCALPKLPGLYTRVSSYLPWIDKMIKLYDGQILGSANETSSTATPNGTRPIIIQVPETSTPVGSSTEPSSTQTLSSTTLLPTIDETNTTHLSDYLKY